MKFFEIITEQRPKNGMRVLGDVADYGKGLEGTVAVICDGIGSGIYANIAAKTCTARIFELLKKGVTAKTAAEMIAKSMHKARTEEIPFSAFSIATVRNDGSFQVYLYEAPEPILLTGEAVQALSPRFYTAGYEVVGEVTGRLAIGESLIIASDGVTQSGMGRGHQLGIGSEGVAKFIAKNRLQQDIYALPRRVIEYCKMISGQRMEDDTTLSVIHCREASELTILTGPPSTSVKDGAYIEKFVNADTKKAVCGSTTSDILARETGQTIKMREGKRSFDSPPEYTIAGVDICTEGAVTLNQVYNIIDENLDVLREENVVERLCRLILTTDVIHFMVGKAENDANAMLTFKQLGIRRRIDTVELLVTRLREKGKLVHINYY